MMCPWFLRIAFFLGVNPYARIVSLKIHKVCGLVAVLFVTFIGAKAVGLLVAKDSGVSVVIFAITFRTFVTCFFVIVGLVDNQATITFYNGILTEIDSSSRTKVVYAKEDFWCLALFLLDFVESGLISANNPVLLSIFIISCALNSLIPLVSMAQFSLCCAAIQSAYRRLQLDLLHSVPRTSSFTLRRIRVRQLDIADRVRDISTTFGIGQLLYILMVQLILVEKVDNLVYKIASKACVNGCILEFASFCAYFVNLWYFSYCPFKAAYQHQEAIATLMDLGTRDMDLSAIQEMALLAEDLNSRETQFSAAGCFYVGFHIFYSVIGIIFSYIMIIGPLAFNKNRALWSKDG